MGAQSLQRDGSDGAVPISTFGYRLQRLEVANLKQSQEAKATVEPEKK